MKYRHISAAVATACIAAVLPGTSAFAAPSSDDSVRPAVLQGATAHAASVRAAQSDTAAMVKALGLGAGTKLTVQDVIVDPDGSSHVRVQRSHKGMPVVGGDLVIHRDASGAITGHDGTFDGKITIDTSPSLSAAQGRSKGFGAAKAHKGKEGLGSAKVVHDDLVIMIDSAGTQSLAYQVETKGMQKDRTPSRVQSFVDADSGEVLEAYDEIAHATAQGDGVYDRGVTFNTYGSGSYYELYNPVTGNYTTDSQNRQIDGQVMTDSDNRWGSGSVSNRQSAGVDAQYGADATFEFYSTQLGRNGIWNNGNGARSRVHYDNNYSNAFWDGTQMTYGDGYNNANPLTELDVAAHEMTHGVTENTAGLIYSGDAGGLNEATSDIFGAAVEFYENLSSDNPDYMMGELIDIHGNGSPLRYMDKPSKDGRSYDCYSSSVGGADPHFSSGPLNHWYYLASEGSGAKTINGVRYNSPTCNSSTVTGAGHTRIEKVWYRTLATKLTSRSTYPNAREGAIRSAIELYGADSQTCRSVEAAFNAISVPAGSAACSGGTGGGGGSTDPVPGAEAVTNGGFENGQTGWTGTEGPINNLSDRPARSGSWKMWLGGNGRTATEYEQQTITVPSSGKLTFSVRIDTAETTRYTAYDKAYVQIIDGSSTKNVATFSNLDASSGYVSTTVDLSAYAGKKVTLKFLSSEDSYAQTSFVFDDVSVK